MALVAGVDTSTQSCKIVIVDAATGAVVREGKAAHPVGTSVHPDAWWAAFLEAADAAGGLDDVEAISVGGQQHGMVCLDADGRVVRDALLWNDTRSAGAALDLIEELGDGDPALGAQRWAEAIGTVPVASLTVTKLRWLAKAEPENAARVAAVCLPHDWLTWRLAGNDPETGTADLNALCTDRSDASGTGYWSPREEAYRLDLLELGLGRSDIILPKVLAGNGFAGVAQSGARLGAGAGDNAAGGFGLEARSGDVVISIGTSGTVFAVTGAPTSDASAIVAGFASADGEFLPLVCTLNAARVLDATAKLLGVDHAELAELALAAPAGSDGLVMVPYLEGERTPNKPDTTGALHGLTLGTMSREHMARAAFEGLLCGLADGVSALEAQGVVVERIHLIGGAAQSAAMQAIAPAILGREVLVRPAGEYVALGAARQAAWLLSGVAQPPTWDAVSATVCHADPTPQVRARYAEAAELTVNRLS